MRSDLYEATLSLPFMGDDFILTASYRVTSWGESIPIFSTMISPPDPLEWEIDSITLQREILICDPQRHYALGPAFEATGALFRLLSDLPAIVNEISESASAERGRRRFGGGRRYVA